MRKGIVFLIFSIILLSSISAYTWEGVKQNQDIYLDMIVPPSLVGYNQTVITSITYPNSTISRECCITREINNFTWNYTYTNTDALGVYTVKGYSTNGTSGTEEAFIGKFEVSGTGITQSTSQGIGSAMFLFLMLVLMIFFGVLGVRLSKSPTFWILGIFSIFLSVIFLVYNTWLGYQFHRSLTGLPDSNVPEVLFYSFLLILVLGLLVSLGLLFLKWKKLIKYFKKEIKTPEKDDDEFEDLDFDKEQWKR